jgi:tellurite resistance protein
MAGFLKTLKTIFEEQAQRHRNRQFLEASMAACALVAMADGVVSFSQRVRVDQVMETLEELKVFDPHDGVNLFNEYAEAIMESPRKGRERALRALETEAEVPEKANLLIRICLAVSEVGGQIPLPEQVEIVALANRLGVDPGACGLYTDGDH